MSQLILPARLKAQPRGHFEIAQGDPLTRGLIGAFPLASDFDDRVHGLVPSVVSPLPFSVPPSSGVAANWRAPNFSSGNLTFNPTKLAPQVSGNFSLSFWANIASQSRYNDIFVTSFGSGLYVQLGNGDIIVNIGDNTGTFLANFYVSPTGFGTNKWMHFVVTVAPTVCHVYFNGVDQGANAISGGIPVLIASGFTGAIGNESNHCDGAISNLLLYDRTISKSDAVELYRNPQHVYRKRRVLFFVATPTGPTLTADISASPEVLGAMKASQLMSGAAAIYPFARAQLRQVNAALALASVSTAMEGSAQARQQSAGSSVAQPVVQGVAQAFQRLSAGMSLQPEVSGVLTASQPGTVSLVGAITVQPGVTSYLSARQSAAASITAPARAAGSFTGINALTGSARALPSVAGAWLGFLGLSTGIPAPYAARGTAYAWQPLQGAVVLQPDISGSIHPPFAGYPVDPHYYAIQPARFFYASMLLRAFYAAQPFRSFYALCNPDMAVQIPYAIDPSETKVITLDATADLPSGVTLTGTPTVDVVVVRGSDSSAASHFTGAVINSTPITVETPTGSTVTIATALAVQLIASGCVDGTQYEIRITCQTSQSNNVEVLKATLTCSAS